MEWMDFFSGWDSEVFRQPYGVRGWVARLLKRLAWYVEGRPNAWKSTLSFTGAITSSTEKI